MTKLQASDGAVLGTFPVGAGPRGIAFDGANIWVANQPDSTVTELRASDGSLVGTFATGSLPQAVYFDGVNIWIGNSGTNTVSKR